MKEGDIVVFIDNKFIVGDYLTLGKQYRVIDRLTRNYMTIADNRGFVETVLITNFKLLSDIRDEQLNKILNLWEK